MVGALLAGIEQVVGIEPDDSGVAHQRVTSTLHLLGGLSRDLVFEAPWRRATRSMLPAWVGWESNPRRDGVRNRYKASVCYQPKNRRGMCIAIQSRTCTSRHRPSPRSRTWTSRVSAKCADQLRQGRMWCCARWERTQHLFHQVPCQAPHHHHSSFFIDRPPLPHRAHLGRQRLRGHRGCTNRVSRSGLLIHISITQSCIVLTIIRVCGVSQERQLVGQVCGRSVRQRMLRRWSCRRATSGPAGLGRSPNRKRATWFPRVALTQSTLS